MPRRPLPADPSLGELLTHAARTLRRRASAAGEPWGVSPHQARALRVIGRHQPTRLGIVAEHLRVSPRSVTDVVDSLGKLGYVDRAPDPDDRRATLVSLTEAGTRVLTELERARRSDADDWFSGLSPAEQDELGRLLRRLVDDA